MTMTITVAVTAAKLKALAKLADWQLREQGFVPASVTAAALALEDAKAPPPPYLQAPPIRQVAAIADAEYCRLAADHSLLGEVGDPPAPGTFTAAWAARLAQFSQASGYKSEVIQAAVEELWREQARADLRTAG